MKNWKADLGSATDMTTWLFIQNDPFLRPSTPKGSLIPGYVSSDDLNSLSSPVTNKKCGGLCCLLRLVQLGFLMLTFYAFYSVSLYLASFSSYRRDSSPSSFHPSLPFLTPASRPALNEPPETSLLDIHTFQIIEEPRPGNFCNIPNLLFIVLVHSDPSHVNQRLAIRETWGNWSSFKRVPDDASVWQIRTVFVLGYRSNSKNRDYQMQLGAEASLYGDILIGSFPDEYHNLRYKHILGLRWASQNCPNARFVLKADDDAFVDVLSLERFLKRTMGPIEKLPSNVDLLACNVLPAGTKPQREGKWAVPLQEYPWEQYPRYCGGLAYVTTPYVAKDLWKVAHAGLAPQVWVDDVWITGLLAEVLRLQPLYMNPRYSYDNDEVLSWIRRSPPKAPTPFTFVHLDSSRHDWLYVLKQLWSHAVASRIESWNRTHIAR